MEELINSTEDTMTIIKVDKNKILDRPATLNEKVKDCIPIALIPTSGALLGILHAYLLDDLKNKEETSNTYTKKKN